MRLKPPKEITKDGKSEVNPDFVAWRKLDRLVLSWIKATVTEAVLGQIMRAKTAYDAWSTLEKSYGSQSPLRIMLLLKELLLIKKGSIQHRRLSTKLHSMFFVGNAEAEDFFVVEEEEIKVVVEINFRDVEIGLSHKCNLIRPIHNTNGHSARTCYDIPQAYSAMSLQDSLNEYWYPDTGTTNHIVASDDMMHNKAPQDGQENVMIGSSSRLSIKHTGDLLVDVNGNSFKLKNTLHVPTIAHNLLSVRKFTTDNDCLFEFSPYEFVIKDRRTNKIILQGPKKCNGLYPIALKRASENQERAAFGSWSTVPPAVVHVGDSVFGVVGI
ncbi:hypothetical protein EJ110_NYTH25134 [Nymphaea thermarum]|nr:hypothetical protein EJ110_NYTH25134 [Nymphaea thermarum]